MTRPYLAAFVGGATISLLPTWLVAQIVARFPALAPQELEIVSEFFGSGIGIPQIIFFSIIVFLIPPIEEVIFRGGLWKLLEWKLSPYWTWILISVLFAAIHMEPLHILGLLPLSFFLGWLRLKTNELGPSIVAHMMNNLVACVLMLL